MKIEPTEVEGNEEAEEKKGLKQRTLSGFFWMFSGTAAQVVLRTLVMMILARLLTPEDFGLVGAAQIVINLANLFTQLGLGPALIQRSELEEKHIRTGFTTFILSGVVIGGMIAAAAPWVASFFRRDDLIPILRVAALAYPLQGLSAVPLALLNRELQFRRIATINVITFFAGQGLIGISLAWLGFGAWALVWAQLAQFGVNVIILLFAKPFPKKPQLDRGAFRDLMYFGGGFTLNQLLAYVAENGDYTVVGRWLGTAALGVYTRAFNLLILPASYFGAVLDQVLFPSMAKIQDDKERLQAAFRYGMSAVALLVLPLSIVAIVLAPEVILVMLGPKWQEVVLPFQILAVGMFFRTAGRINTSVARATGAIYRRAWREAVNTACVIVGAWIGQQWGVPGVAAGVLVALTVNYLLMTHFSLTLLSMKWQNFLSFHAPALILSTVAWVEVWPLAIVLRNLNLPAMVILLILGLLIGLTFFTLARQWPEVFLGPQGIWMFDTLTSQVKKRIKRRAWTPKDVVAGK